MPSRTLAVLVVMLAIALAASCRQIASYGGGDAPPPWEAGLAEAGPPEAGPPEAGLPEAGLPEAGPPDGPDDGAAPAPDSGTCAVDGQCSSPGPCGTVACIGGVCQATAKPSGTSCGGPAKACEQQPACDGASYVCPAPKPLPVEIWKLAAATATTVWKDASTAGLDASKLAVGCEGGRESRSLLIFPSAGLPPSIEIADVSLSLCTKSVIGPNAIETWLGSFADPPTTANFSSGWNPPFVTSGQVPKQVLDMFVVSNPGLLTPGQDAQLGLRVPSCAAGGGAVFVSPTSVAQPSCGPPLLSVTLCRVGAGDGRCKDTSDCPPVPQLPCATGRCVGGRCEYAADPFSVAQCRPAASACDIPEACNGLTPACPPDLTRPLTSDSFAATGKASLFKETLKAPLSYFDRIEASCDSTQQTRGVAIFKTSPIYQRAVHSVSLEVCLEQGAAPIDVWVGPTGNIVPSLFNTPLVNLVGTTTQTLNPGTVETIPLDAKQISGSNALGFMLDVNSSVSCTGSWRGRRYGWTASGCANHQPMLHVEHCAP